MLRGGTSIRRACSLLIFCHTRSVQPLSCPLCPCQLVWERARELWSAELHSAAPQCSTHRAQHSHCHLAMGPTPCSAVDVLDLLLTLTTNAGVLLLDPIQVGWRAGRLGYHSLKCQ